jgi:hypothetical protein
MALIQKLGSYFFILGALIAILSSAFPINPDMQVLTLLLLILTGAFVGLLNVEEEREVHFLIASGVFIIASGALNQYLTALELLSDFKQMLTNLIIFSASASIVVGLKLIFHYASFRETAIEDEDEPEFDDPRKESVWNVVILVALCLAFTIFILEVFFYINGLTPVLEYLSYVVIAVFIVDLVILATRSKGVWYFFRHHWADIISVIPFSGAFQLAKIARIARIAKFAAKTSRVTRMAKISHSTKFFSTKSGFNEYLDKKKK